LATWLTSHLVEWRYRIRFHASDWKLSFAHRDEFGGGWRYARELPLEEKRSVGGNAAVRFTFKMRFFNEKSRPIGLHKFSVQFTNGPRYNMVRLFEVKDLRHGDYRERGGIPRQDDLDEIQLPSCDWSKENVAGFLAWNPLLLEADTASLVAYTASGKCRRWKIAKLALRSLTPGAPTTRYT
jgi:hypothetical protein